MFEVEGCLLDEFVVCIGGGLNVMGFFYFFFDDKDVWIVGVEVGGKGFEIGEYVVLLIGGILGVLYGN